MKNIQLIIDSNYHMVQRIPNVLSKDGFHFYDNSDIITPGVLKRLINFGVYIHKKYPRIFAPIVIRFKTSHFSDKLTITLLECICYQFMSAYNHDIKIIAGKGNDILSEGFLSSPLQLLRSDNVDTRKKYCEHFKFDMYRNHYRRVISNSDVKSTAILSEVFCDISSFQKNCGVEENDCEILSEIIIELVGNASDHTESDCILDIDITNDYNKINCEGAYFGINVNILNFSTVLFYEPVKEKLQSNYNLGGRYKEVQDIYNLHRQLFDETYTEEDFFSVASFQHRISGRQDNNTTGGTGLTKLVKGLQEKSDAHKCYLRSGCRQLNFLPEYLEYGEDEWVGFNEDKDFKTKPPSYGAFQKSPIVIPGTAYNLTFVMRKGEENGK